MIILASECSVKNTCFNFVQWRIHLLILICKFYSSIIIFSTADFIALVAILDLIQCIMVRKIDSWYLVVWWSFHHSLTSNFVVTSYESKALSMSPDPSLVFSWSCMWTCTYAGSANTCLGHKHRASFACMWHHYQTASEAVISLFYCYMFSKGTWKSDLYNRVHVAA